jgi:hypothetical protein
MPQDGCDRRDLDQELRQGQPSPLDNRARWPIAREILEPDVRDLMGTRGWSILLRSLTRLSFLTASAAVPRLCRGPRVP